MAFCMDIISESDNYKRFFINYPMIVGNSSVSNSNRWKKNEILSFINTNAAKVDMEKSSKITWMKFLFEISYYIEMIYQKFYEKKKTKLYLEQK